MFFYNLKITLRSLFSAKLYTWVNVFGLTLSLSACMVIASVVVDELSYDRFWSRADDVYRLVTLHSDDSGRSDAKGGSVFEALGPSMKRQFPEVEEYASFYTSEKSFKIKKDDPVMMTIETLEADSAVYHLLDVQLTAADVDLTPTKEIKKVIVSETFAQTHFKSGDALGAVIYETPRYGEKAVETRIVGIMKDFPKNTFLRADIVALSPRTEPQLGNQQFYTYSQQFVCLAPNTDKNALEAKLNTWITSLDNDGFKDGCELQSIKDAYLKSDFPVNQPKKGNISHLYIFSAVSALILLIACINYINLATARANSRLQDMAVRKILGASQRRIIVQFLQETAVIFSIACVLSITIYPVAIRWVEDFIGHALEITLWSSWLFVGGVIALLTIVCFLTAIYPAWHISDFRSSSVIKNQLIRNNTSQLFFRKSLVTLQFSISIAVLIALFVVHRQFNFMRQKDVGYDVNGLIGIDYVSWDGKGEAFKQELSKIPAILSTTYSTWLPTHGAGYMTRTIKSPEDENKKTELWYIAAEPNFAETIGLRLKSGRLLQDAIQTDAIEAGNFDAEENATRPALMSASTAKVLGLNTLNTPKERLLPVGITEDFNTVSFHKKTLPTVIVAYRNPSFGAMLIKSTEGQEAAVIKKITSIWDEMFPNKPLIIHPIADELEKQYLAESKLQTLISFFSSLSILLAVLGLFALTVNSVQLRTKEIGIRKVLGASVSAIVAMLSKDFVKLVLIAMVIASPIAWWAMNTWLEDFAYRIDIQWWMFVLAGLVAVVIALLTVSSQAIRAAVANPVDSLRDE